jgi:hypothetical protein
VKAIALGLKEAQETLTPSIRLFSLFLVPRSTVAPLF